MMRGRRITTEKGGYKEKEQWKRKRSLVTFTLKKYGSQYIRKSSNGMRSLFEKVIDNFFVGFYESKSFHLK